MVGWKDEWIDVRTEERIAGRSEEWMDGRSNGWKDRQPSDSLALKKKGKKSEKEEKNCG